MKLNKMKELNKKTTSILIITILMLSMAIALPMASAINPPTLNPISGHVGIKVTVSGVCTSPGGLIKVYWDSVKAWDGTAGLLGETYAVGIDYSYEITIPEAKAELHYVIIKDVESSEIGYATFTVDPKIVLSPTAGIVGDTITVTGTGFNEDSDVTMIYTDPYPSEKPLPLSPSTPKTSSLGSFTATFAIPADAAEICTISVTAPNAASVDLKVGTVITLTPKKGLTGTTVTVAGRGFTPDKTVDVKWHFGSLIIDPYMTIVDDYPLSATGSFTKTITVPPVDPGTYLLEAIDSASTPKSSNAFYEVTGATKITLVPTSGLAGAEVSVEGEWFTSGKTVTIYFDGVSVGTAIAKTTLAEKYGFTKSIVIPEDATLGAHTIKAMDSEGVYATKTFTVIEEVITIKTRSDSYDPRDTISFTIESTVAFDPAKIAIVIADPDGYIFWSVEWNMIAKTAPATGWYVPYAAQTAGIGLPLTLPSDVTLGIWEWTATYRLDGVTDIEETGTFTVGVTVGPQLAITYAPETVYEGDEVTMTVEAEEAPVADVSVWISNPAGDTYILRTTDDLGTCTFTADEAGEWWISAWKDGYTDAYVTIEVLEAVQPELPAETTNQAAKDSTGAPKTSFVLGETVLASAEVTNAGTQSQPMLIIVQWTDPELRAMAPVFIGVTLAPGQSFEFAPGLMLPLTGYTKGTWTAKILVLSAWPAQGGVTIGLPVTITITVS